MNMQQPGSGGTATQDAREVHLALRRLARVWRAVYCCREMALRETIRPKQQEAIERAAALLAGARLPVIGGLQTDIAGAQVALALAEKLGGVIDHAESKGLSTAAQLMREAGSSPASFGEVRNRADIVVAVGRAPLQDHEQLIAELFPGQPGLPRPGDNQRQLILLGGTQATLAAQVPTLAIAPAPADLPALVASFAAAVAGRSAGAAGAPEIAQAAERLRGAAFAVFVYLAAELEIAVQRTILDTVRELCLTTRAATFTLPARGNGDGVNLCSTWTCGLPVATSFAGPIPEHNAALYAAGRLVESGEADALLWIDALNKDGAPRPRGVPTILITSHPASADATDVVIEVGAAGRDHDAALYLPHISGIGMVKAEQRRSDLPSASHVLRAINARVKEGR